MKLQQWRRLVPYGKWTCADGREVLFNRGYMPILERVPGVAAKPADPNEWVEFEKQEHFFDDGDSPTSVYHRWNDYRVVAALKRCNAVLVEWGYPELPRKPRKPHWRSDDWVYHENYGRDRDPRPVPYAELAAGMYK